ncbi:MAG: hypothetical protein WBB07_25100 [Mycobacterium sp.]
MTLLDILPSLRSVVRPRVESAPGPRTIHAEVIDEADFRYRARCHRKALPGTKVLYAGTTLSTTSVARWAAEENLGAAVCSPTELATVLAGGINPARVIYHGLATRDGMQAAVQAGVGRIVVESKRELTYLAGITRRPRHVLLRSGDLAAAVIAEPTLRLVGLYCRLGAEAVTSEQYRDAAHRMVVAMADLRRAHGVVLGELYIGDARLELQELAGCVDDALDAACAAERFPRPLMGIECHARAGFPPISRR